MKLFTALIFISYSTILQAQPIEVEIMDGPFQRAIDWYIKSTMEYIHNLPSGDEVKSINQFGIVAVKFYNEPDSIGETHSKSDNMISGYSIKRSKFKIYLELDYAVLYSPPTFYLKRGETFVVVYDGLEPSIKPKSAHIKTLKRIIPNIKFVPQDFKREFMISLTPSFPEGFSYKQMN